MEQSFRRDWTRGGCATQRAPCRLGSAAVHRASGRAGRQLRLGRPERHRCAHPALGSRAQPADAAARPGVDPPAPGDPRRSHRRADRGGRHDAQRNHAAAATSGRGQPLSLRLRVGSGRGRPQARLRLVDPRGSADRRSARSARRRRASSPPNCSPSTRCMPASPKRRSSSCPMRSCRTCPESGAHVPRYRSWIDAQDFAPAYAYLHRMLQFLQWQKRQRGVTAQSVGAQVACAPWISGHAARSVSRPAHRAHAPRPQGDDSLRRQPERDTACDARRRRGQASGRCGVAAADGLDQRPCDGRARRMGRRGGAVHRYRVRRRGGRSRSLRWPVCTTPSALPLTTEAESAMRRWLIERPREPARPPYPAEDFGLTDGQIDERFAAYNSRFRSGATPSRRM